MTNSLNFRKPSPKEKSGYSWASSLLSHLSFSSTPFFPPRILTPLIPPKEIISHFKNQFKGHLLNILWTHVPWLWYSKLEHLPRNYPLVLQLFKYILPSNYIHDSQIGFCLIYIFCMADSQISNTLNFSLLIFAYN